MTRSEIVQAIIQGVGLMAVVISLVFVGLQLRQSQEIAIAAQYQARLDAASSHYAAVLQSEPGLRVIGRDLKASILADPGTPVEIKAWVEAQPEEELAFRAVGAIIFLKSHDNVFFQYEKGFLSEEAWKALRLQLKAGLNDPNSWVRSVYEEEPMVWRESYRELIQEILAE
ncbi:MAG: hypothetical protein AB3N64_14580 [Puniceicoccaceae bacterium]